MIQNLLLLADPHSPRLGARANEAMITNLYLTLKDIAESTVKAVTAQQKSLNSLVKLVPDTRIVLHYLLAEQGGVCAVANTTCCTQTNASRES